MLPQQMQMKLRFQEMKNIVVQISFPKQVKIYVFQSIIIIFVYL